MGVLLVFGSLLFLSPRPSAGAVPDPLALPDSALDQTVRDLRGGFEAAWNGWLIAWLRQFGTPAADSIAPRLERVARTETDAFGTHIGGDALRLVSDWNPEQRQSRIAAHEAESLAVALGSTIDAARPRYHDALERYGALGERRRRAVLLGGFGGKLLTAREFDEADSIIHLALAARRAIGDRRLEGNSLNDLGLVNYSRGRPAEAVVWLRQAIALRETTKQPGPLGTSISYLAVCLTDLCQPDSVEALHRRAVELTEESGDQVRTLTALVKQGGWLADYGDSAQAAVVNQRAIELAAEIGESVLASSTEAYLNFGRLRLRQARFGDAIDALDQSVGNAIAADRPDLQADGLIELGLAWLEVPEPAEARRRLRRALVLGDSLGDVGRQVKALNNLALVADADGQAADATRLAKDALRRAVATSDSAGVHDVANSLGNFATAAGDRIAAATWMRRAAAAISACSDAERAADLINLGWAELFVGHANEAERHFEDALELARRTGAPDLLWPATLGIGELAERRGDFPTALRQLRESARLIDGMRASQGSNRRSIAYLAGRFATFEGLIHLLGRLDASSPDSGYAAEAFEWSERARGRALRDLLEANGIFTDPGSPPSLAAVQSHLAGDEAVLYYSVGDSSSTLWALRRDRWKRWTLPARPRLSGKTSIYRKGLASPETAETDATLRRGRDLFAMLVAPAAAMLDGVHRLRVAPDGPLWFLPFEALRDGSPATDADGASSGYLVERWDVSYLPSALGLLAPTPPVPDSSIVVVANPTYGRGSPGALRKAGVPTLSPLPGTAKELETIRGLTDAASLRVLTGARASRRQLLRTGWLEHSGLLHLAAHGSVDDEPELSGIWLAPDTLGIPSRLTVGDLLDVRPRANLVTLSACRTGLGRLERGEGVLGLTRSFLAGGSRSVVVSLWDANDTWTPDLMGRFYRGYLKRNQPLDRSLAQAKRDLIHQTAARSPYYWALFVAVGDPGSMRPTEPH